MTASQVSGAIALTESRFGSSATFTVADTTYGLDGTHAGADVVGTIDGVAAEGTGRSLRATAGDSTGLTLQILATQDEVTTAGGTLDLGSVTVRAGVAQRMEDFLDQLQDTDGRIAEARNSAESMIDFINDRIEVLEDRIEQKELTLRRQFTALESAMNDLMVLSSSIASQLSGLPTA